MEYFETVPFGRIVAGGEGESVGGVEHVGGVGDEWGGCIFAEQDGVDVVAGEDFGGGFAGLRGEETAIIADDDALFFQTLALDISDARYAG